MKKGLVSILIVNWNQQEFLDDCFKSIFYQTYKNYEVIVLDNASSDSSLETLKKYTRKKNFTLIESKELWQISGHWEKYRENIFYF